MKSDEPGLFAIVRISRKNARKMRRELANPKTDPDQRRLMEYLLQMYEERQGGDRGN